MIACLYIPDFPSWAVEKKEPGSSVPLAVIAAGRIISSNRIAQRQGVLAGISAERARTLAPELKIHLQDGDLEKASWEDLLTQLNEVTPFIENAPPPFVYLKPGEPTAFRNLVKQMRGKAGLASRRSFARLAAVRAASGNLLTISEQALPSFFARFPLKELIQLGFEEDLIEKLELFGYNTLKNLAGLSEHHLAAQFGPEGSRLFSMLHPEAGAPIKLFIPPPSVEHTIELDQPLSEPGELNDVLKHLTHHAVSDLSGLLAQRVTVATLYHGSLHATATSRVLGTATNKAHPLLRAAELLLRRLLGPDKQIDTLKLQLGALRYAQPTQTTLFRERPSAYSAVKAVHRRHPGLICKPVVQAGALFPDETFKLEPFPEPSPTSRRTKRRMNRIHER